MTIRELSEASGITAFMLSQIEHGQVNPSINSLNNIAKALGVPLYRFFQEEIQKEPVVPCLAKRHGSDSQSNLCHNTTQLLGRAEKEEPLVFSG